MEKKVSKSFKDVVAQAELEARFWTAQRTIKEEYIKNDALTPQYGELIEKIQAENERLSKQIENSIEEVKN